jgi:DNA polymerase-3 subunit alpha
MIVAGTFVHIRGRVQEKWGQIGMLEFKPTQISQLSEIRNLLTKSLVVDIPAMKVDQKIIDSLESLVKEYPGKCGLRVRLYTNGDEKIMIDFMSRRFRVDPCNEVLEIIEDHPEMTYRLRRK